MESSPDWDLSWQGVDKFVPLPDHNMFSNFFDRFIPDDVNFSQTAIEVGCFPGRFIDQFGRRGYIVSGVDTYPGVVKLNEWMRQRNHRVGDFICSKFSDFVLDGGKQFDLVTSFGFIEHFVNFPIVIKQHVDICNVGGIVIIGAPNFSSPVQRAFHKVLDPNNLSKHVLSSMYPMQWNLVAQYLGLEVLYFGNLGRFGFWYEDEPVHLKRQLLRSSMATLCGILEPLGNKFNNQEPSYNVIVMLKKNNFSNIANCHNFFDSVVKSSQYISDKDDELSAKYVDMLAYFTSDE